MQGAGNESVALCGVGGRIHLGRYDAWYGVVAGISLVRVGRVATNSKTCMGRNGREELEGGCVGPIGLLTVGSRTLGASVPRDHTPNAGATSVRAHKLRGVRGGGALAAGVEAPIAALQR